MSSDGMRLRDFRPRSQLVTKKSHVRTPRFPVIDAHNHLMHPFGGAWDERAPAELVEQMDASHVRAYVDLDGGWGEDVLHRHLDRIKNYAPDRFRMFGGVAWRAWPDHGERFGDWAAAELRRQALRGAEGLKIWKPFGLEVKDHRGSVARVDDPRLDVLWATAAELRLPVMIHVADPVAFFEPLDRENERWEELEEHPDWHFPSPPFPAFATILDGLANLVTRHPKTTFIGAHVASYAENLAWVSELVDRCPNLYVDISARIAELGRQPYTARRFFERHRDRILFGIDVGPRRETYEVYYRFLETDDEYFEYDPSGTQNQGRWRIYGLNLSDDVLRKIYFENAERLFGVIDAR
jgi:predicted TIM-barrel fold metal-dependent hydrolase